MTDHAKPHPFIDDLSEAVVLESSILRRPVTGRELVLKVVKAGASQYVSQKPRFLQSADGRSCFEYDVDLAEGAAAVGLVSILRDASGAVTHLHIAFSPLGAVLSMAAGVRDTLAAELGSDLFL